MTWRGALVMAMVGIALATAWAAWTTAIAANRITTTRTP